MAKKTSTSGSFIVKDLLIVSVSVLFAVFIVKSGIIPDLLSSISGFSALGSFVAGMFFTSIFTTAPAMITLGEIAETNSLFTTAIFGAAGAVIGDMVIFRFVKDRLSEHLLLVVKHNSWWRRIGVILKLKYFRWGTFLMGGILIASPFVPDELAISLMGLSKMKLKTFVVISFIFNVIGIVLIGTLFKAFS